MCNHLLGSCGLILACCGVFQKSGSSAQKKLILLGASLLTVYAILERSAYFISLEIVVVTGAWLALTSWPARLRASLLIIETLLALAYLLWAGEVSTMVQWMGATGLTALAFGFAFSEGSLFLVGGVLIATYSGIGFFTTGSPIGLVFFVLNVVFSVSSAIGMVRTRLIRNTITGGSDALGTVEVD